ncbi:MAG: hypothetical protein J6C57_03825 [Paludibacteraceae bacterium]|nr:hypothetical protein [Paludibacteraceae bacterium]MBR2486530.1 hypothetical protein [Paludibacteraceae bacterium]
MKKIYTTILLLGMTISMSASFHLTIEKWVEDDLVSIDVTKDTTIIVTEYEYDEDLEEATMGVEGVMYSDESQQITVSITRSAEGIFDQFCAAGNCVPGNSELTQELEFTIGSMASMRRWFTHYTVYEAGTETIVYSFNDGINPALTLTVKYSYMDEDTAVDNVVVLPTNNIIYNLLGQRMPTTNWEDLSAGIYIINGKKYIKQ